MKPVLPTALFVVLAAGLSFASPGLAGTIEGQVRPRVAVKDLSSFVIWVEDMERSFPVPDKPAVMNQKDLQFDPHVLAIQVGTTVQFPNSDPVSHNVFSISKAKRFNLGMYRRGKTRWVKFDQPGVVDLLCNVHLEMSAYIVVLKSPYFVRTGADGTFSISGVPAGRYRLHCWHERLPTQEQEIEVPAEGTVRAVFDMGLRNN